MKCLYIVHGGHGISSSTSTTTGDDNRNCYDTNNKEKNSLPEMNSWKIIHFDSFFAEGSI